MSTPTIPTQQPSREEMLQVIFEKINNMQDVSGLYKFLADEKRLTFLRPILRAQGINL